MNKKTEKIATIAFEVMISLQSGDRLEVVVSVSTSNTMRSRSEDSLSLVPRIFPSCYSNSPHAVLFFTALKVLTYLILESYGLYRLAVHICPSLFRLHET